MRIVEDCLCIVCLTIMPDWFLEVSGIYASMYQIIGNRIAKKGKGELAMIKLKPCPFCGGKAEICTVGHRFRVECMIEKGDCAVIPITWDYETKEEAADAWNGRYNDVQE